MGVDEINNDWQDYFVSLVCLLSHFLQWYFILSPSSLKLLPPLLNQHTNIHNHHHYHHHKLRSISQPHLLNLVHYSLFSIPSVTPSTFSTPSLFRHAQDFHILRTIFFDPTSPSSYHSVFSCFIVNLLPRVVNSHRLHFFTSHSFLDLYSSVFHPHHLLKSFKNVGRTFMFLHLMGTFWFSLLSQEHF